MPTIKPIEDATLKDKINMKLRGLGVSNFSIGEPIVGPVVTGYPIKLSPMTSVKEILSKSEDIAFACGVTSVDIRRINHELVIFIPNQDRTIVDFKDALFWMMKDEEVKGMELPILLGQDYEGKKTAIDLTKQPHMLIAGSTGSGKSILESSIIAALTTMKTEDQVQLYIVDPKRVDLTLFDSLPHVKKTIEDIEEWYPVIDYLYAEVQNRNKFLKASGSRNIKEYNDTHKKKMAYKVLIIDELADLIEKDKYARQTLKETIKACKADKVDAPEMTMKVIDSLQRLVQVSRAAGIHIIACTQRTSTDVINGTIKANFPTRISLRLPSWIDSKTILDEKGAENLLGKGDMLIKSPENDTPQRFHAPFVRMEDIKFILQQREMILDSLFFDSNSEIE